MVFLAPAVLYGLAAISVPVVIHLLNKLRVQVVKWGATRFLLEILQKNKRRLEMEDMLLLLLRCLFIALLALAFARPVLHPEGTGAAAAGLEQVMILVDQSASMGQSNGVETRFEQARAAANKVLDELAPGSLAGLLLITDRVNAVVPRPTANLALVRRALAVAEPGCRTSDFLPGIRAALDTLRPFTSGRKEIVILSDNQAVAWKQLDAIKPLLAQAEDVHLRIVPLEAQGEDNLAITALSGANRLPAAGQLFGSVVEIHNYGATPATGVRVTLSLNDEAPADEAVIDRIEPGQSRAVPLNVRFSEPGFQTLRAAIPPDRFPADNQRSLAVWVIDQMRATIIESAQPANKVDSDGFFLANALVPVPPALRPGYYLKVEAKPVSWIEASELNQQDLIFLCNIGRLSTGASEKLQKYVMEGGALILFPGARTQPADYNNNPALAEMLPATLGPLRDPGNGSPFTTWQDRGYTHPVTAIWNDPSISGLATVQAIRFFPLKAITQNTEGEAPRAVVNYSDGTPAVMERTYGKGKVILFSSSATPQWSNLPIHPNFVPLLKRLTAYAAHREGGASLNLAPGAVFQQTVAADLIGREFSVLRPDGKGKPRPAGRVEAFKREAMVRYFDTETPGAYRLFINGNERPAAAFAVQMDPRESDLHVQPPERLAALTKEKNPVAANAPAKGPGAVRQELWTLLLWIAAAVGCLEMLLAHKFSRAK